MTTKMQAEGLPSQDPGSPLTPARRPPILPRVNWGNILLIAGLLWLLIVAGLRVERRARPWMLLLLALPTLNLLLRWAAYREAWLDLGAAAALAGLLGLGWCFLVGRRLPPPTGDSIRVWSEDDEG
ncbi:MAG: hypothetical protein AB1449_11180 [Chloroflexota bacterium]